MLSRRGEFYINLLGHKDPKTLYEKEFVESLKTYLDSEEAKFFAIITKQTQENRNIAEEFKEKYGQKFEYEFIQLNKKYRGVTCMLCQDKVILGWNKGEPEDHTTEGMVIRSSEIYTFISGLLRLIFPKWEDI